MSWSWMDDDSAFDDRASVKYFNIYGVYFSLRIIEVTDVRIK